ncbi:MAG: hypothetical protein WC008_00570 [Bacilli bacterium]
MKKTLIKIWGDVVDIKDLLLSILIISTTTLGSYFLAPKSDKLPLELFFGLGGAVIGFIITIVLFKPKRVVNKEDK